jgi:hypothetical protein
MTTENSELGKFNDVLRKIIAVPRSEETKEWKNKKTRLNFNA